LKLQSCRRSKCHPNSFFVVRTVLEKQNSVFGSTSICRKAKSDRTGFPDLSPKLSILRPTLDQDSVSHDMGLRANAKVYNNAGAPTEGDIKVQLPSETPRVDGDSNGGSIQDLPKWAIERTGGSLPLKLFTLVIVQKDGKVLLGMKKRG
jgi:hypothetical protein